MTHLFLTHRRVEHLGVDRDVLAAPGSYVLEEGDWVAEATPGAWVETRIGVVEAGSLLGDRYLLRQACRDQLEVGTHWGWRRDWKADSGRKPVLVEVIDEGGQRSVLWGNARERCSRWLSMGRVEVPAPKVAPPEGLTIRKVWAPDGILIGGDLP